MAITSIDQLVEGAQRPVSFRKAAFTGEAAGEMWTPIFTAGFPGAASAPTGLNGSALTSLTGQIPFPSAVSGQFVELAGFDVMQGGAVGGVWLCDLLWWNGSITATTTTNQAITHPGLPARDRSASTNGDGVFLGIMVSSATGNGSPVTNMTAAYCVDPKTECLTRRGWARYDALRPEDELLAFDPVTQTTRWETPREIYVNPAYRGDMILLSSRRWSALTTPDHRWPVVPRRVGRARTRGRIEVRRSYELPRHEWSLLRSARHEAPNEAKYSDALVRVVAWFVTEGSLRDHGRTVTLCQSITANPVHVEDIRRDLKELGAQVWSERTCVVPDCSTRPAARDMCRRHYHHWWTHKTKRDGLLGGAKGGHPRRQGLWVHEYLRRGEIVTWQLAGDEVGQITACAPGKAKVPTMDFLTSLTHEQLRMFVDVCIAGDGTPEKRRFYQHNADRMDAFVAAAVLAGYGPTVDGSGTACSLGGELIDLARVQRQTLYYEGAVWCPVTESGHWVARRNGKVFITGNTDSAGNSGNTATMTSFPATAVAGHVSIFNLAAGDTGTRTIEGITLGTSLASGTVHLFQFRPIAYVPLVTTGVGASMSPAPPRRMWDSSVPFLIYDLTGTAGGIVSGLVQYSQG